MAVHLTREQALARCRAAFDQPRSPRSAEYKAGVLWALMRYTDTDEPVPAFVVPGTAASDAFHAGVLEGHAIARHIHTC